MKSKKIIGIVIAGFLLIGITVKAESYVNMQQFLNLYLDVITSNQTISDEYKNIKIKYKNINDTDKLYNLMQKAIYTKQFANLDATLALTGRITQDRACTLIKINFKKIDLNCKKGVYVTSKWLTNTLIKVKNTPYDPNQKDDNSIKINLDIQNIFPDNDLINQIYNKLNTDYLDAQSITGKEMIYNAIEGMVSGLNDEYTVFFPPTDAKNFNEELEGEYEGIGAYVEMKKPGELIITSPILGSPAEKAGIMAGDIVTKIGENTITDKIDIQTAISWIKGPSGSSVKLTILRNGNTILVNVNREKITIRNTEAKIFNGDICYMDISMFGYGVLNEFTDNLTKLFDNGKKCKKYIWDVRGNPGGSLEEVAAILDYFVPNGKDTVIIKSKDNIQNMTAVDRGIKLYDKNMTILMDKYSASASEIFAGTIKDYVKNVKLIGEKTFGKGSVQELVKYWDGSMLKYTIAKRFTGKSETSVDKNGLEPDIKVLDDIKTPNDEQLEFALTEITSQ